MTSAIIVAAGSSRRMGFDKLAVELAGIPVLARSMRVFEDCEGVEEIVVVTSADRFDWVRGLAERYGIQKPTSVVGGGVERHLSVWNGIEAADSRAKLLAVHDGARPLVTVGAVGKVIAAAKAEGAASLAHRVADTLKRADAEGRVTDAVSREELWAMETPQVFSADLLKRAYRRVLDAGEIVTDEVSAIRALGEVVRLVENPEPNPKITFAGDLALAEAILAAMG